MVVCENLVKIYKVSDLEVFALQGLDLHIDDGEMMAIIGNSGSGKSTLLNMLGGLDQPTAGQLLVDGKNLLHLTTKQRIDYKRSTVGFVWQNNGRNLLPYLSALQNVEVPMLLRGSAKRDCARELLEMVGIGPRMHNRLAELSGGEQQRVAIAIALANRPRLLLADEPTGNVDTGTAAMILDVFRELTRSFGLTIVVVTHDMSVAKKVDRIVAIRDGRTSSEIIRRVSAASVAVADPLREVTCVEDNPLPSTAAQMEDTDKRERIAIELTPSSDGSRLPDAEEELDTHIEYAVLDSAGRLQIPAEYLRIIGGAGVNKLQVTVEGKRIVLVAP